MTNDEARMTKETRSPKPELRDTSLVRDSLLVILSSFGLRHWSFAASRLLIRIDQSTVMSLTSTAHDTRA